MGSPTHPTEPLEQNRSLTTKNTTKLGLKGVRSVIAGTFLYIFNNNPGAGHWHKKMVFQYQLALSNGAFDRVHTRNIEPKRGALIYPEQTQQSNMSAQYVMTIVYVK